jgi:hypothetical protein
MTPPNNRITNEMLKSRLSWVRDISGLTLALDISAGNITLYLEEEQQEESSSESDSSNGGGDSGPFIPQPGDEQVFDESENPQPLPNPGDGNNNGSDNGEEEPNNDSDEESSDE